MIRLPLACLLLTLAATGYGGGDGCVPRDFGQGSVVCECNSTYCDLPGVIKLPPVGQFWSFTTNKAGKRFEKLLGQVQNTTTGAALRLSIISSQKYQKIKGFGGAMTDAAAMNILSLSPGAQDSLLKQYFSPEGAEYSVVRVPMASCDFSSRLYTYADTPGDFQLLNFSLAPEDLKMKIPLLQRAQAMSPRPLSLLASAWSSPAWLKTNGALIGKGTLKGEAGGKEHETWANYYVRFLDEYKKHNLTFWAVTTGNEPTAGLITNYSFQALGFTAEMQRDWVARDLGPAIARSQHTKINILLLDDERALLPHWAKVVLSDIQASRYIHGIGVHWYWDPAIPAEISLSTTHHLFPGYYLFGTEACAGFSPGHHGVKLGCWDRAERYAHDIIEDLNHYVTGWTDWNLVLDLEGGPNWVKNFVDSPIIVSKTGDVFYKQPTFYIMAHFSKFLWAESQRVGVSFNTHSDLESCAFVRLDGSTVLEVLNRSSKDVPFEVWDPSVGYIPAVSPARSVLTLAWATR
ncbi:lysosomal acid glucosylceramidase [Brienomyrus brachyistius]|uniref:lysosomal acid glucosylceramidase n=1 Tax=Brienomyrus brachyistius TaxID=42636 RepID=UPI0020B2501E|nr:lysosomal acid glucosylceramidase [Brienomyrus brachyistius]XP_048881248.1 lysosomal acid glucosylceramidase [Brienomyrus brachyistius]